MGHHSTILLLVWVTLGGLFVLAFLPAVLCCFMKWRKKKQIQETDDVDIDGRMKVKEAVVPGRHGEKEAVAITIEGDIHAHEKIHKSETVGEKSSFSSRLHHPGGGLDVAESSTGTTIH